MSHNIVYISFIKDFAAEINVIVHSAAFFGVPAIQFLSWNNKWLQQF